MNWAQCDSRAAEICARRPHGAYGAHQEVNPCERYLRGKVGDVAVLRGRDVVLRRIAQCARSRPWRERAPRMAMTDVGYTSGRDSPR
jgi:hypothetical protein